MPGIVKDDAGRVRSGWVLLVFSLVCGGTYLVLNVAMVVTNLSPTRIVLDDWRLAVSSTALLLSAVAGTLVCRLAFRAEAGLGAPVGRGLAIGAAAGIASVTLSCLSGLFGMDAALRVGTASAGAILTSGLVQLVTIGPTSVGEELLLRGVALRQLARGTRPWIAIVITGGAFGVMHLENPSASPVAALNIALVGIWFGAMVWRTGTLWTAVAMHVTWNWFEGFVFGTPVSGVEPAASLLVIDGGPLPLWSGGNFGPEAGPGTTVVLALANIATLMWPKTEAATATLDSSVQSPGTAGSPGSPPG